LEAAFNALQIMLAAVFLLSAIPKLTGAERMRATFAILGVPQPLRLASAAIELAASVALLVGLTDPSIAMNAALSMMPVLFGMTVANITRSRRKDAWMPTAILLFLCGLVAYVRYTQLPG
jgi:uncharacterized membrane protein YphA (DoxX/SURF4 family)